MITNVEEDLNKNIEDLIKIVNHINIYQDDFGCIIKNNIEIESLLLKSKVLVDKIYLEFKIPELSDAYALDINKWIENGLESKPFFNETINNFRQPNINLEYMFFIGVVKTPNGPNGNRSTLECFLFRKKIAEEIKIIEQFYPHPKNTTCSVELKKGSDNIIYGNCLVFFTENIQSSVKLKKQSFAIFFFNKFFEIYQKQTLPLVSKLFYSYNNSNNLILKIQSRMLDNIETYSARCIWGYLHDYFHHQGNRPLDQNIYIKTNFFTGLLEELKVDCQTIITCIDKEYIPYRNEIIEFILFERICRYPNEEDALKNFDSACGIFLFEYLYIKKTLVIYNNKIILKFEKLKQSLESLVYEISEIENEKDDIIYKNNAVEFVRIILPKPLTENKKFYYPKQYLKLKAKITQS